MVKMSEDGGRNVQDDVCPRICNSTALMAMIATRAFQGHTVTVEMTSQLRRHNKSTTTQDAIQTMPENCYTKTYEMKMKNEQGETPKTLEKHACKNTSPHLMASNSVCRCGSESKSHKTSHSLQTAI
jgi:hypothetical protein